MLYSYHLKKMGHVVHEVISGLSSITSSPLKIQNITMPNVTTVKAFAIPENGTRNFKVRI